MDWGQTLTIIGTLGGLMLTLYIINRFEVAGLRHEIAEIRKDVRLILDKIIPPYNKESKVIDISY